MLELKKMFLKKNKMVVVDKIKKVYTFLLLCFGDEQMELMSEIENDDVYGIWTTLLKRYERETMASKLHTRQQLHV